MEKRLIRALWIFCIFGTFSLWADSYHELQKGETLYRLSVKYGISVEDIQAANNIQDVTDLRVGMRIRIPGTDETPEIAAYSSYTVERGDTYYAIARDNEISLDELYRINGIRQGTLLKVGQVLKIPGDENIEVRDDDDKDPVVIVQKPDDTDQSGYFWPHNGNQADLAGKLVGKEIAANNGDPVLSVSSGKVIWVAPYHGYGKIIMVESPDKHIFAYGGNGDTLVDVGDSVSPGQKIGLTTGSSEKEEAKVYFFVYKNGKPVDPSLAPRK